MDDESKDMEFPAQYMFKDVPDDIAEDADPVAVVLERDGPLRHREGHARHRRSRRSSAPTPIARCRSTPTGSSAATRSTPTGAWRACATSCGRYEKFGIKAATAFPAGMVPQVPINDKKFYPLYAKCVELDIPICITHRRARAAGADAVPEDRAARRGVLVLPRAEGRDAPRRRAVGRAGREAHAQVAEPLLLDLRVRAEVLPADDHRLRQHAAAPTRSCTPATSRWACRSSASSRTCRTSRSRTTCGRSSCARTPSRCSTCEPSTPRSRSRCRSAGSASATPTTSPSAKPKPLYYFDRHLVGVARRRRASCTSWTRSARTSAPTSATAARSTAASSCARSTAGSSTPRAQHRHPLQRAHQRQGAHPHLSRWSSSTASSFAWYHPDESVAPMWDVPTFPEFNDDPDWSTDIRTSYESRRRGRRWPRTASTPRTSATCTTPRRCPSSSRTRPGSRRRRCARARSSRRRAA